MDITADQGRAIRPLVVAPPRVRVVRASVIDCVRIACRNLEGGASTKAEQIFRARGTENEAH